VLPALSLLLCVACDEGGPTEPTGSPEATGGAIAKRADADHRIEILSPRRDEELASRAVEVTGKVAGVVDAVIVRGVEARVTGDHFSARVVLEPGATVIEAVALASGKVAAVDAVQVTPPRVSKEPARIVAHAARTAVRVGDIVRIACELRGEDGLPLRTAPDWELRLEGPAALHSPGRIAITGTGPIKAACAQPGLELDSEPALLEAGGGPAVTTTALVGGATEAVVVAGEVVEVDCAAFDADGNATDSSRATPRLDWTGDGIDWLGKGAVELTRAGIYELRCQYPGVADMRPAIIKVTPDASSPRIARVALSPSASEVEPDSLVTAIPVWNDAWGNRLDGVDDRVEVTFVPEVGEAFPLRSERRLDRSFVTRVPTVAGSLVFEATHRMPTSEERLTLPPVRVTPSTSALRVTCPDDAALLNRNPALSSSVQLPIPVRGYDARTDTFEVLGNNGEALTRITGNNPGPGSYAIVTDSTGSRLIVANRTREGHNFVTIRGFRRYDLAGGLAGSETRQLSESLCSYMLGSRWNTPAAGMGNSIDVRINQRGLDAGPASRINSITELVNAGLTPRFLSDLVDEALAADPVLQEGAFANDFYSADDFDDCAFSLTGLISCVSESVTATVEMILDKVGINNIWDACIEATPGASVSGADVRLWFSTEPGDPLLHASLDLNRARIPIKRCMHDEPHGSLSLNDLRAELAFSAQITNNVPVIELRELEVTNVEFGGSIELFGMDFDLTDQIGVAGRRAVEKALRTALNERLASGLTPGELPPVDRRFALPDLTTLATGAGSGADAGLSVGLQASVGSGYVHPNGFLRMLVHTRAVELGADATPVPVSTAALATPVLVPGTTSDGVAPTAEESLAVSTQQALVNDVLHTAWRSGWTDTTLPVSVLGEAFVEALRPRLREGLLGAGSSASNVEAHLTTLVDHAFTQGGLVVQLRSTLPMAFEGTDPATGDYLFAVGPVVLDLERCRGEGCPDDTRLPVPVRLVEGGLGGIPAYKVAFRMRVRPQTNDDDMADAVRLQLGARSIVPDDVYVALDASVPYQHAMSALDFAGVTKEEMATLLTHTLLEEGLVAALRDLAPVTMPVLAAAGELSGYAGAGFGVVSPSRVIYDEALIRSTGRLFVAAEFGWVTAY
jgi:hypothetical protein